MTSMSFKNDGWVGEIDYGIFYIIILLIIMFYSAILHTVEITQGLRRRGSTFYIRK